LQRAEVAIAELEASALTGYEDGWHKLRSERDELKAKVAELEAENAALKADTSRINDQWQTTYDLMLSTITKRAEAAESRLAEKQSNRDTDWILALGHAVGLDSGLNVPIIPDPEVVREFLGAYVKTKLADIAGLVERWEKLPIILHGDKFLSGYNAGARDCADELQAALGQG